MAEQPAFESPITRPYRGGGGELTLSDRSASTKMVIRAGPDTAAARQLAVRFGSSRRSGEVLICGQRPDEWTAIGPAGPVAGLIETFDRSGHVSVLDLTHALALLRLTGRRATAVLEKICDLDWSDPMTPNGAVTSAMVADVDCDIIRSDIIRNDMIGAETRSYLLACDRSLGQFLFDAVLDAGAEFAIGVGAATD